MERKLSEVTIGETFWIGGIEFLTFGTGKKGIYVTPVNALTKRVKFGDTANYEESDAVKSIDEFTRELLDLVGKEGMVKHRVHTTCLDGTLHGKTEKTFGTLFDIETYRKYRSNLDKILGTPFWMSNRCSEQYASLVCGVYGDGALSRYFCDYANCSVRPFYIFQSDILVSCEEPDGKIALKKMNPKEKFQIGDHTFRVLEVSGDTVRCISDKFIYDGANKAFGNSNDWKNSRIREDLNTNFLSELEMLVGKDNIIEHKVDLTSNDGLNDYGTCLDKVSLLTTEQYRKYRPLLMDKMPDWWWTVTPYSTESNGYSSDVCCVCGGGALNYCDCDYAYCGVRPSVIFSSSILVSKVEE